MRIAVVGNGAAVHVVDRTAALAALGHEVRLITLGESRPCAGVAVRTRPIPQGPIAAVRAARGFLDDVRSFEPDLLLLQYAGGKLGTMATLARVRPLVVVVMGGDVLPEQHPGGMSVLERRAARRILQQADLILLKSESLRSALQQLGDPAAPAEVVPWGVDTDRFHPDADAAEQLRARLGLNRDDRVIVSPRSLQPIYNIDTIVEAMPAILRAEPRAVLLVCEYTGDPDYEARVRRSVEALGIGDRVRFQGVVDHRGMPAAYSLAEVVVSIPSSDGLPQSLFEAMACGVPTVLGNLPSYREIVTHRETALITEISAGAVAAAVTELLGDDELRSTIAVCGRARVAEVASMPVQVSRVGTMLERLSLPRRRAPWNASLLLDLVGLLLR